MAPLKLGSRLRSAVCATEVMVVAAPDGEVDVRCGGVTMLAPGAEPESDASLSADHKAGTQLGKRYTNETGDLELLCTKPGEGSLSVGDAALTIKGAKPLPSSD